MPRLDTAALQLLLDAYEHVALEHQGALKALAMEPSVRGQLGAIYHIGAAQGAIEVLREVLELAPSLSLR